MCYNALMSDVFEAEDARGRKVICTNEIWNWHILDFHPELEGLEAEVKDAIEHPFMGIYRDTDYENRDVYYKMLAGTAHLYLKVVVEFDENYVGRVVTAFKTDSGKSGEELIWPTSNP